MNRSTRHGILLAILAACLYAINAPFSKLLLQYVPPTIMAGMLYIGAGAGMGAVLFVRKCRGTVNENEKITRSDMPYVIMMVGLDVAAPILLLFGLDRTTAANASLLNNFEIVATAMIALIIFGERISRRLWIGIGFVTLSCGLLSFEDISSLQFSLGSIFVLLAAFCWGLENNCTRKLSAKDPLTIVLLKGVFSGSTSLIIGLIIGERTNAILPLTAVLAVGFVAYGLSIFCYVYAQRVLGAARTGAYYAVAPFISTMLSLVIFRELPPATYFAAFGLMAVGAVLCSRD